MTQTKRILAFVLVLVLCVGLTVPAMAEDIIGAQYEKTAGYVAKTVASPGFGSIGGDWAVLGLARGGADVKSGYFEGYYERLESYVKSCEGVLHKRKYTEYSRVALAVTAIGKDARDVAGYDLLLPLGDYEKTVYQGVNGAIFALLALDAGQYEVPVNTDAKTQATRELYVQKILDSQLSDGGWNIAGTAADADLTAMALQALAGYTAQASVKTAIDKGVAALSKIQGADGGFSTGGAATCESNAQVLVALAELGISLDDSRFVKNGNTALDALLTYANADDSFRHTLDGEANEMATEQALYALAAVKLAESGKSLYKMDAPKADTQSGTFRDVVGHKNQKAIEALAEKGVINGEAKKTDPGKMVSTFLMGSKAVYDFIDDNPGVLMMDVGYTNDPYIISQNDRFVAINSALQVDLTGQVCADSLGTKFWSGVGGQIDFVYGASLSKGGKAIIAMPSITNKGVSKICPTLLDGAGVVTTRNHIHWFVTEFGAVDLYGKTLQERARLLISIAHPSAQEELDRAAFERWGSHHHYIKGYMK